MGWKKVFLINNILLDFILFFYWFFYIIMLLFILYLNRYLVFKYLVVCLIFVCSVVNYFVILLWLNKEVLFGKILF